MIAWKNNDSYIYISYVINPGKQAFNGLTFVHKYTHIHIVNQYKADLTIHVQCYDIECQSNTQNHKLPTNSLTVCYLILIIPFYSKY